MAEHAYDFAIIGGGALAQLVAGLLVSVHGRSTVLVTTPPSPFRLPHRLDIGLSPMTRPDGASLLLKARAETLALLGAFGKGAFVQQDIAFLSRNADRQMGLGHFRHLMRSLGETVDPLTQRGSDRPIGVRARQVPVLPPARFGRAASDWVDRIGVRRLDARQTAVALKRDGTCRLSLSGITTEAGKAVLLGDDAILSLLQPDSLDRVLVPLRCEAGLFSGGDPGLVAPVVADLDSGLTLEATGKSAFLALTDGRSGLDSALAAGLKSTEGLHCHARTSFEALASEDNAPYFGHVKGGHTLLAAAQGPSAAFLSPLVARWLVDRLDPAEAAFVQAAGGHRGGARPLVAEFGGRVP